MGCFTSKASLWVAVVVVATLAAGANAGVLYDFQTYASTQYSGAAILGTAADVWNHDNSIAGTVYPPNPDAILSNVALVDSTGAGGPSAATFSISDATTGTDETVQNSTAISGNLGDYWYVFGNATPPDGTASSADFLGTFGNLSAYNGVSYTLVIYGFGTSITNTGGTFVTSGGLDAFGKSQGYEEFTGHISGGQVLFDINNTQSGGGLSDALLNGAQLLINTPEPATVVLFGLATIGLFGIVRRQRRQSAR